MNKDSAPIYTIHFEGEKESKTDKFFEKYIDEKDLELDFDKLSIVIDRILENGSLERYFKNEGKYKE